MKNDLHGIADKRSAFMQLHEQGCFLIPNPWDVGSACALQRLGAKALATTSAGLAWSSGMPDHGVTLERTLAHLREIVDACQVPVSADFGNGFDSTPDGVSANVRLAVETGIAGLSIEDSTGDPDCPLYPLDEACKRVRAARTAIDGTGGDVVLVARAECFFVGKPELDEVIARLRAYASAGADCLYAPGLRTREQIEEVVHAVSPKPVNVLVDPQMNLSQADLARLGVRRVSVGGSLARVAWDAFMRSAESLFGTGGFTSLSTDTTGSQLNRFFAQDRSLGTSLRVRNGT